MTKENQFVNVKNRIYLIRRIASAEIFTGIIILLSQTIGIGSSYQFSTRSVTGIWTSWIFIISAGFCLFWSTRCTFLGLQAVLVLQIISAAMGFPLFTATCLLFGVYPFNWSLEPNENGSTFYGSSVAILTTNLIMMILSIVQIFLNSYNSHNCYLLAYGRLAEGQQSYGQEQQQNGFQPDHQGQEDEENDYDGNEGYNETNYNNHNGNIQNDPQWRSNGGGDTPSRRQIHLVGPYDSNTATIPADVTLTLADIDILKYCGAIGIIIGFLCFCIQIALLVLSRNEIHINIGIGIWGGLYYGLSGGVTLYLSLNPSGQSSIVIFILQVFQIVLSVPLVAISYCILAIFGSCLQYEPLAICPLNEVIGLTLALLGGIMALIGTTQALISIILICICSKSVFDNRCLHSGATVYPNP